MKKEQAPSTALEVNMPKANPSIPKGVKEQRKRGDKRSETLYQEWLKKFGNKLRAERQCPIVMEVKPEKKSPKKALTIAGAVIGGVLAVGGIAYGLRSCEPSQTMVFEDITTSTTIPGTPTSTETPELTLKYHDNNNSREGFHQPEIAGRAIPVLRNLSELKAVSLNNSFPESKWLNPIYDESQADAAHDWRGIGPWYPVAFTNIDHNAAKIMSHGNVGELIIQAKRGGKVQVAFWQIDKYQSDGAWGHDANGNMVKNPDWTMQYTFKGVPRGTEFHMIDADTGKVLTWPDGTPVVYLPSKYGDFSFEMPKTYGNDVRVAVEFCMPAAIPGEQALEIKIERGPNDHPELKGENPLPESVIKCMVPAETYNTCQNKPERSEQKYNNRISDQRPQVENQSSGEWYSVSREIKPGEHFILSPHSVVVGKFKLFNPDGRLYFERNTDIQAEDIAHIQNVEGLSVEPIGPTWVIETTSTGQANDADSKSFKEEYYKSIEHTGITPRPMRIYLNPNHKEIQLNIYEIINGVPKGPEWDEKEHFNPSGF